MHISIHRGIRHFYKPFFEYGLGLKPVFSKTCRWQTGEQEDCGLQGNERPGVINRIRMGNRSMRNLAVLKLFAYFGKPGASAMVRERSE
jgi:hypothetical protein